MVVGSGHGKRGCSGAFDRHNGVKMSFVGLIAIAASAFCAVGADIMPAALVGEWAPAQAVFRNGHLEGGYALYISTNGLAAVVMEPGFLRVSFHADYCVTSSVLTLRIDPKPYSQTTLTNRVTYDPIAKKLVHFYTGDPLSRYRATVPQGVIEPSP